MSKNIIIVSVVVVVVLVVLGFYLSANNSVIAPEKTSEIIGGQRDAHGCLGPADYSWCEAKQKCLRVWEEKCEVAPAGNLNQTFRDEARGISLEYSNDFGVLAEFDSDEARAVLGKYTDYLGTLNRGANLDDKRVFTAIYLKEPKIKYANTGLDNAFVTLATNDSNTKDECYSVDKTFIIGNQTTENINGIEYVKTVVGDMGMGHFASARNYNLFRNGMCYVFSENMHSSDMRYSDSPVKNELDSEAVYSELHAIMSSIKFDK